MRAALRACLDEAELRHAAGLPGARREHFEVARGALRVLLGAATGRAAPAVGLVQGPRGKPALADPGSPPLRFNVSHAGGIVLIAVGAGSELGVDVERVDPALDWAPLAAKVCSPRERALLSRLPAAEGRAAFFRVWCRKEAYLKARGDGFHLPPAHCEVSLLAEEPARLLDAPGGPPEVGRWSLQDVPVGPGYAAALVTETGARLRASRELTLLP